MGTYFDVSIVINISTLAAIILLFFMSSLLGVVENQKGKMVICSAPMEGNITERMTPLYWRKEIGHGRLEVTLTSLRKM